MQAIIRDLDDKQKVKIQKYLNQGFDSWQLTQIKQGITANVDVDVYAKKAYSAEQMSQIRLMLIGKCKIPYFISKEVDSELMHRVRILMEDGKSKSLIKYMGNEYDTDRLRWVVRGLEKGWIK